MKTEDFEKTINDLFAGSIHDITKIVRVPNKLGKSNNIHSVSLKLTGAHTIKRNKLIKGVYMLTERLYEVEINGKLLDANYMSTSFKRSFENVDNMIFFIKTFSNLLSKLTKTEAKFGLDIVYIDPDNEKILTDLKTKSSLNKVKYVLAKKLYNDTFNAKATIKIDAYRSNKDKIIAKIENLKNILGDENIDWKFSKSINTATRSHYYFPETFTLYLNKENVDIMGIAIDDEILKIVKIEVIHGFH